MTKKNKKKLKTDIDFSPLQFNKNINHIFVTCTPLSMRGSLVAFHTNLGAYICSQHTPAVERQPRLSLNIFISKYEIPHNDFQKRKN